MRFLSSLKYCLANRLMFVPALRLYSVRWEFELASKNAFCERNTTEKKSKCAMDVLNQTRQPIRERRSVRVHQISRREETYGSGLSVVLGDGVVDVDEDTGLLLRYLRTMNQ